MEKTFTLEDCNCAVCFKFKVEPVELECGHSFCLECLQSLAKKSQKKCPMCRKVSQFNLKISKKIQDLIIKKFPEEYKKAEIDLQELRLQQNEKLDINCWVGNEYELLKEDDKEQAKFTLLVRHSTEKANPICLFKKITYTLPEPYRTKNCNLEFPFSKTHDLLKEQGFEVKLNLEFEDWMAAPKKEVVHKIKGGLEKGVREMTPFVVQVPRVNYEKFMAFIRDKIDPNYPDLVKN